MPLEELLKMYGQNAPTTNRVVTEHNQVRSIIA